MPFAHSSQVADSRRRQVSGEAEAEKGGVGERRQVEDKQAKELRFELQYREAVCVKRPLRASKQGPLNGETM